MRDEKREAYLRGIIDNLPESPGVYQYLNEEGKIIYVGKAKKLKRRVSSYFRKDVKSLKTHILTTKIWDIKYIVVNSEEDALLLENNLIKKYKPRYNVLLKDDKTYPSICVTNEYFPRILKTRRIVKSAGTYFGPYSHMPSMLAVLELIRKMYPIRTCHLNLSAEGVRCGKFKVCLEYHIKNCLGPCEGLQTHEDYMRNIAEAKQILRGNTHEIRVELVEKMKCHAEKLEFEEAQVEKNKIALLDGYRSRSEVVSNVLNNIDVFSIEESETGGEAYINYLHITNGCINQAFTFEYKKRLDEERSELLALGIVEMRERYKSRSKEIIVPFLLDMELEGVTFTIPQKGDKKKLLDLSLLNVRQYKADRLKQSDKLNPQQRYTRVLKDLQESLKLPKLPMHIECFDNSNIQGAEAVAACVVFKNGKPSKNDYRKFNIRTVEGADDYASMREVVFRRYSRLLEEEKPLPDLIIADGGKGQMEAIRQITEDKLRLQIPIAGLAKDDRHRTSELLYGFPPQVVGLKPMGEAFRLLTRIQDEVHRFAITFHRAKRSKSQIHSEWDDIKGIGTKTRELLMNRFKSLKRIKLADYNDIKEVIGERKAKILFEHFSQET